MSQAFKLPDLGEGIHEGEVVSVMVSAGDRVSEGQPILEVETDKASVQIPSPYTGVVKETRVKPGDIVKVGHVMIVFGDGKEVAVESTDGTTKAADTTHESKATPKRGDGPVPASPATRKLARELGIELRLVTPSGPAGLVTAEDVRAFAQEVARSSQAPPAEAPSASSLEVRANGTSDALAPSATPIATPAVPPLPDFGRWGSVERVPLRSVRRATAAHMALAWSQVPHVNHQDLVDITRLEQFRKRQAPAVEARDGKLTLTVFVLKAAVAALKAYPRFNSSLDMERQEIVQKQYYHLGVAVDSERGLIVPVIRDVDRKSILELSLELKQTAERTRSGQLALEEMQGGTFTITNIGALGGTGFAPIVNYPEVAILGMGRARWQPVVLGDQDQYEIVPRLMMPLVLAFDHRVLDGADAARFTRAIVQALENPDDLWLSI